MNPFIQFISSIGVGIYNGKDVTAHNFSSLMIHSRDKYLLLWLRLETVLIAFLIASVNRITEQDNGIWEKKKSWHKKDCETIVTNCGRPLNHWGWRYQPIFGNSNQC